MRKVLLICLSVALCLPSVSSHAIEPKAAQQISTSEMTVQKSLTENNGFNTIVLRPKNGKITVFNAAVITYPNSVKLKKKGCQNIPITYKTYIMDDWDYVDVGIIDDANENIAFKTVYQTTYYSEYLTDFDGSPVKVWKKSGKAKLKICREAWFEGGDPDLPRIGATKGNFQLEVETANWRYIADIKLK
jgi:hypothetical protein